MGQKETFFIFIVFFRVFKTYMSKPVFPFFWFGGSNLSLSLRVSLYAGRVFFLGARDAARSLCALLVVLESRVEACGISNGPSTEF